MLTKSRGTRSPKLNPITDLGVRVDAFDDYLNADQHQVLAWDEGEGEGVPMLFAVGPLDVRLLDTLY